MLYDSDFGFLSNRHMSLHQPGAQLPFKLMRWFSLASFVLILAFALANAYIVSTFLTKHLLHREAQVTGDFVLNILQTDGSVEYLANPEDEKLRQSFLGSVQHFVATRDILRTNVYARNGTVLWSTEKPLVGKRFTDNHELDEAFAGDLVVESGGITSELRQKPEHVSLPIRSQYFVETYIPVTRKGEKAVIGVVEIYKAPVALTESIHAGFRQVWITAAVGAIALYLTLFWIVFRADRTIRQQHDRLVEAEAISAASELTSSMAHNIRNPLASIRSSAELAIDLKGQHIEEQGGDIIKAVDRIEGWIRELLRFTRNDTQAPAPIDIGAVLASAFDEQVREFQTRGIAGSASNAAPGAKVLGDAAVLAQLLHSLIANAIDATPQGGRVDGVIRRGGSGRIEIQIKDTGHGIAREHLESVFRPFYTTKKEGLGLGLSLARRAVERMGGTIRIQSAVGTGTIMTLDLPAA